MLFVAASPPTPSLPDLLAACVREDRHAQRRLYGQFYAFALGICLRYSRHREQAVEAVNDGFIKIFHTLGRFDPGLHPDVAGSFRGWLKRIMIHTAIDHYRAEAHHQHGQELTDAALNRADHAATPLDSLSYDELLALVQRLPPAYRTVFNLAVIDDFSHEEIARQLGISVGTSKSNLSKARAHLRVLLAESSLFELTRHVAG